MDEDHKPKIPGKFAHLPTIEDLQREQAMRDALRAWLDGGKEGLEEHLRQVREKREQWEAGEEERRKNPSPLMRRFLEGRQRAIEERAREKGEVEPPSSKE